MNFEQVLARLLAGFPDLMAVYVFGSQATGEAHADSDLDLAVLAAGPVDPLLLWQLSGALADIVAVPVDLLDLRTASTVMQYQVITTGHRLWMRVSKVLPRILGPDESESLLNSTFSRLFNRCYLVRQAEPPSYY